MSNEKKLVPKLRFEDYKSEQEWEKLRVEDLGEIVTGTTPPTNDNSNYGGQYLFISPVDIQENRYVDNTVTRLSKKGFEKGRILPEGTTLFVSIGSTIGKVAQIRKKAVTNQQINAIIPNPKYNPNFILSLFKKYTKEIRKISSAQAVPIINKNTLSNYGVITTKNIKEQQQIGTFFKKIDKMIRLQQAKVNKIKDIKSAYLSEMFPKEDEKYPKKRFEGFKGLWEISHLGQITAINKGEQLNKESMVKSGKYYVLNGGINPSGYTNTYNTKKQTISISEGGNSCGYVNYNEEKFWSGGHNYALTNPKINVLYLYYFLKSRQDEIMSLRVGSGLPNIQITALSEFDILYPLSDEQIKIGNFFKNLDKKISIEKEKLAKLEKLKQAYLNDMFI